MKCITLNRRAALIIVSCNRTPPSHPRFGAAYRRAGRKVISSFASGAAPGIRSRVEFSIGKSAMHPHPSASSQSSSFDCYSKDLRSGESTRGAQTRPGIGRIWLCSSASIGAARKIVGRPTKWPETSAACRYAHPGQPPTTAEISRFRSCEIRPVGAISVL